MMELLLILPITKAVFLLSLPRAMDMTKWTNLATSAITQYHTCQLQHVGPSEGHSLLKKSLHAGQALVFDSSGCNNNMTHACNFLAY
jgi:hypothetical protein